LANGIIGFGGSRKNAAAAASTTAAAMAAEAMMMMIIAKYDLDRSVCTSNDGLRAFYAKVI
jgi:ribosomal protein S11